MAANLASGGEVTVANGQLVVKSPRKTSEDGRAAPVSEEFSVVEIPLDDIEDVKFSRAGRLGYPGAVQLRLVDGSERLLRMFEDDALPFLVALRGGSHMDSHREVVDTDSGGASEE